MVVYTSSYNTMLNRTKSEAEVYIQVSRSLGHFASPDDTTGLCNLIDEDWGEEFGNWSDNQLDYKKSLRKKDLRIFAEHLRELTSYGKTVFLLCFENVLAGETCHRRWLAKILEKSFSLKIPEWQDTATKSSGKNH